eukprot:Skav208263  [mRNA]  locus=scaffold188:116403:118259:+ [translate_table: standard]
MQDREQENVLEIFEEVRGCARDMEMLRARADAHSEWKSTCAWIVLATRRVQELLQPFLEVEVVPADSDVLTHPTDRSHPHALLAGSATRVTWSALEETLMEGEVEDIVLLEQTLGGEAETRRQYLEHKLLELQNEHGGQDHCDIASTLHELGVVSRQAGDLEQAKLQLGKSLRMRRSARDSQGGCDGDMADTLHELSIVSRQAGDLQQAEKQLGEWGWDRAPDDPDFAAILHELGIVSCLAGDLEEAKQLLEESLEMKQAVHGDRDHPGIAATLHELGVVSHLAGDLEQAKLQLGMSLRMNRRVHADRDHPDIAADLHELGIVSRLAGDLEEAKQLLEESLEMKQAVHGDRDHPGIAATLHELGIVSHWAGDLEQAKLQLGKSLRMNRRVHADRDHPDVAADLHELGIVSRLAGNLEQAKLKLEESLRMRRSLNGNRDRNSGSPEARELKRREVPLWSLVLLVLPVLPLLLPLHLLRFFLRALGILPQDYADIAETLHETGLASWEAGDLERAKQHLEESLQMYRSLDDDSAYNSIVPSLNLEESLQINRNRHIAATLHELSVVSWEAGDLEGAKQHFEESRLHKLHEALLRYTAIRRRLPKGPRRWLNRLVSVWIVW